MSNVQVIVAIAFLLSPRWRKGECPRAFSVGSTMDRKNKIRWSILHHNSRAEKENSEGFRGYVRLNTTSLEKLLLKKDTVMWERIIPEEVCCVALRYFASGESFRSLEYQFRISRKSPWPKLFFNIRVYGRWCLSSNCVHHETISPKKPEFREVHIQLPTFKIETHIRKRIWHPR